MDCNSICICTHIIGPSQEPYFLNFITMNSNTSLHKITSLWIPSYSLSKFFWEIMKLQIYKTNKNLITQKLTNNIFISDFLLPSNPFKSG
jgi:hypothetical protein